VRASGKAVWTWPLVGATDAGLMQIQLREGVSLRDAETVLSGATHDAARPESCLGGRVSPRLWWKGPAFEMSSNFINCSMDETAKIPGISVAAAKARLFHARASLRGNKALLLNHEAARHVSRKRFSCGITG
jgi:hypothetical protein